MSAGSKLRSLFALTSFQLKAYYKITQLSCFVFVIIRCTFEKMYEERRSKGRHWAFVFLFLPIQQSNSKRGCESLPLAIHSRD